MSERERLRLYPDSPSPTPPELLHACDRIIATFQGLPNPTPERYFILLRLVLGNVIGAQITWDCTERRDMAMTELFERLEKDMLQLSNPNAGAQGHG
jgi:hypothetical protein